MVVEVQALVNYLADHHQAIDQIDSQEANELFEITITH